MVQASRLIVKAEQERGDATAVLRSAEASNDAIRGPVLFHFEHRALARAVRIVDPLGDNAVQRSAALRQP